MSGYGDTIMGGMSTYADRAKSNKEFTVFLHNPDRKPGRIDIHPSLLSQARGLIDPDEVVLQPHVNKPNSTCANKDWGWYNWLKFLPVANGHFRYVQFSWGGRELLPGIRSVETPTFEHAAAMLYAARGVVTTDGGIHHAAAALKKPAVVIWGASTPPYALGYKQHENLWIDDPECLGWRVPKPCCREAMDKIMPELVLEAMFRAFGRRPP